MFRFKRSRLEKKHILLLLIIVMSIFIKIGYSYLTQELNITGTALASKNVWDVHFVEDTIDDSSSHISNCVNEDQCSKITKHATIDETGTGIDFGVTFHILNDYYEFVVDVVNDGTIDAMLQDVVKEGLETNSEYLSYDVTYSDGMPIAEYDQLLKCGGKETLKVKVTFIHAPENDVNANLGITVNYIQADQNMRSRSLSPEARIRSLNVIGESIADDDPDHNLRFIGKNPNNYVLFNGQKWRIIGVFDGKLKIVQDPIGNYSWDSSGVSVNNGYGVNQWGGSGKFTGADLMKLLNPGFESNKDLKCTGTYSGTTCGTNSDSDFSTVSVNNSLWWNAKNGECYNYANYKTSSCDFRTTGLQSDSARNMIDNSSWYLGSVNGSQNIWAADTFTASFAYQFERGNLNGKQCSGGTYCTDTVSRTTSWNGRVGLIYPSDYIYATSGGSTYDRNRCLTVHAGYVSDASVANWNNTYTDCKNNDWLLNTSSWTWTLSPRANSSYSIRVFHVTSAGYVNDNNEMNAGSVRPVVFLKSSVSFTKEGNGTQSKPFILRDLSDVNTVTFDANGGVITPTSKQVNSGSQIGTLPVPTAPTGKVFDGWYTGLTDGTKITSSYKPTKNVTIYAHWTPTYKPEARIRALNTIGTSIADDDPDGNLRFIGSNPNNYVRFNNQTWRIIGVFDGRLKLIQNPIGNYSWDTSKNTVNNGYGVNQWGPNNNGYTGADLMKLLNPNYENNTDLMCNSSVSVTNGVANCGDNTDSNYSTGLVNNSLYWNASSGKCYTSGNYNVANCNFSSTGLSDSESKKMIDNSSWYLGSNNDPGGNIWDGRITANVLYNWERSNNSGKQCSSGAYCTDSVERTTTWTGKVGLIYPSDYAYATAGGATHNRSSCLSYTVGYVSDSSNPNWQNTYTDCKNNDWLLNTSMWTWTLSPRAGSSHSYDVFYVTSAGYVSNYNAMYALSVCPVVFLKSSVLFTETGNGTQSNPFILKMED